MAEEPSEVSTRTNTVFFHVEHAVYIALGVLLSVLAVVALAHAGLNVLRSLTKWDDAEQVFTIMDELLFVLMLAEILHTVRVSIQSGTLQAEPFLIVGLIASIRRVLVITLKSSENQKAASWSQDRIADFTSSMVELGVLAVLILVMVVSIYLIRRAVSDPARPGAGNAPGG
jgi:uncharacterized membrane protein (DUF373 family)